MDAERIYTFDRQQWLRTKYFLDRTIVFLDLNFWIGMSEGRDQHYVELKELLLKLVTESKVICPVSPTLLLELKKRPASEKRTNYCHLMGTLSQGLSVRTWFATCRDEFRTILERRRIEAQIAYSHFVDAFSASTELSLVIDKSWPEENAREARNLAFDYLYKEVTIDEVVSRWGISGNQEVVVTFLRNGLSQVTQQEKAWRQWHTDSRIDIEQAEFTAALSTMLPQIFDLSEESESSLFEKLSTASIKKEIWDRCPTFWCHYQLMTALRLNREKLGENDLWDLEHAASALPYVNCFACDKGTRHLCSEVLNLDGKYGTAVISKVDDLVEWVKALSSK